MAQTGANFTFDSAGNLLVNSSGGTGTGATQVQGNGASGAPPVGNPLNTGMVSVVSGFIEPVNAAPPTDGLANNDGLLTTSYLQIADSGTTSRKARSVTFATGTTGAGIPASGPLLFDSIGGVNFVKQAGDGSGRAMIVGAAATGAALAGNPVPIAGTDGSGNIAVARIQGQGDATSSALNMLIAGSLGFGFNETNWDRYRNNTLVNLLPSAPRTGTTSSTNQTNFNARGFVLVLNVTSNPGGAQTLTLNVSAVIGGNNFVINTGVANAFGGGAGSSVLVFYPGAATAWTGGTEHLAFQTVIPRTWFATVTHSGAGSWTYTLDVAYIL